MVHTHIHTLAYGGNRSSVRTTFVSRPAREHTSRAYGRATQGCSPRTGPYRAGPMRPYLECAPPRWGAMAQKNGQGRIVRAADPPPRIHGPNATIAAGATSARHSHRPCAPRQCAPHLECAAPQVGGPWPIMGRGASFATPIPRLEYAAREPWPCWQGSQWGAPCVAMLARAARAPSPGPARGPGPPTPTGTSSWAPNARQSQETSTHTRRRRRRRRD